MIAFDRQPLSACREHFLPQVPLKTDLFYTCARNNRYANCFIGVDRMGNLLACDQKETKDRPQVHWDKNHGTDQGEEN